MRDRLTRFCLLVLLVFLTGPLRPGTTTAQTRAIIVPDANAEFPPADYLVWSFEREGLLKKAAARRLADAPDSPETVVALLQARRVDDALHTLRVIVDTRPDRIGTTLELMIWDALRITDDQTRDYRQTVAAIFDAVKQRVPRLPREEAAHALRWLLFLDGYAHPLKSASDYRYPQDLAAFTKQYEGTETAALAEVDVILQGRTSFEQLEALERFARAHPRTIAGAKALFNKAYQLGVNIPITG